MKELPADSEIGRARRYISEQCRAAAGQEQGIYRLHVPTGGGKTLAGLRYALAHAQCYNKSRVVFVSPLLTILDQNARVIRDYIQDDRLILEHHANIVQSPDDETQSNTRLLTDNWGAPIIITTLVQLLNTLFSGKTAAIRRFWALCESVIVIDEIQSLPVRLLSQFNMAVSFLSEVCGATIVLCSATQPCLEAADRPLLRTPVDMVPYEPAVWECFRRTELRFAGHRLLADIPEWIGDMLQDTDSLLLVCNKKDEAGYLYRALAGEGRRCYLLSAAMCSAHRKNVLRELYAALRNPAGTKVVCVSTQVIEAGVDITFSRAVRLCAGLDNAVQTAGRCNRNRESAAPAPVYLVDCEDENLSHLPDIRRAKEATTDLLVHFSRDSARFRDDLTSSEAVRWYYRRLYAGTGAGFQDCALPRPRDKLTQYDLLSENASLSDPALCPAGGRYFMRQAFKLAGDSFEVFEGDTFDVVVPYEEGRDILCELNSERAKRDFVYTKALLSRAKAYTISLFGYQKKRLESVNGLYTVCDGAVLALEEGHYDGLTGLTMDDYSNGYQEV